MLFLPFGARRFLTVIVKLCLSHKVKKKKKEDEEPEMWSKWLVWLPFGMKTHTEEVTSGGRLAAAAESDAGLNRERGIDVVLMEVVNIGSLPQLPGSP